MAVQVSVREKTWREILEVARKVRRKPEVLVENALRDYTRRIADEELDAATRRAARRAKFRIADTEEIIRQYRRMKAKQAADGRTKKADAGRH